MKISRIDLDGTGSPMGLVTRIFKLEPDLLIPVPLVELCERLDIVSIDDLETDGFEAALVTDVNKSAGGILVAKGRSRQRRRYSIGHELGHFLIPTHVPGRDGRILCSQADFLRLDTKDQDRRKRMEAEANQFAALLLMPPHVLRSELAKAGMPDLAKFAKLADLFDVSKQALASQYVIYHREAVAIIQTRDGKVVRSYRDPKKFPWIEVATNQPVPPGSALHHSLGLPGTISDIEECEPDLWLSASAARTVASMTEQALWQRGGYALIMLHADIVDEEDRDRDEGHERRWGR
ncbi:MAG: ImmA/IrrE family metallo-endopeptidase [Sphingomonadaceae bacterium]